MLIEKTRPLREKLMVTIDGNEYAIAREIAVKYGLRKDASISPSDWLAIQEESQRILCKEYLYKMVSRYLKTEQGYRDKLYQVGYHKSAVENALDSAKSYGYIDDEKYCQHYIMRYKDKKGGSRLKLELRRKGVDSQLLNQVFADYEPCQNAVDKLSQKFMRTREKTLDNKQKLYRHLLSKGFTYEQSSKAVDKCYNNAE